MLEACGAKKVVYSTYGLILSLGYFVNVFKLIEIDGYSIGKCSSINISSSVLVNYF